MFTDKDYVYGTENSENSKNPNEKTDFSVKNDDFIRKSDMDRDGGSSNSLKIGNLGSQELTLSYLCENFKMGIQEKEVTATGKNFLTSLEKGSCSKGKEIVLDSGNEDERWVERDFLQLNGVSGGGPKRDIDREGKSEKENEKKPKLETETETLNLSLGLPDVSLSLASPNRMPKAADVPVALRPSRSTQSLVPSNNNTRTGSSDDFTGAASMSMSYSYSVPFSHNPSCSLTRNSTDFYEYSVGSHRRENDPIWNCGEGTNGSVHSRFKPVGDGVVLANHNAGTGSISMQSNWPVNKDSTLYRTTGSENLSFFPSDLPARQVMETQSNDSRGRASDRQRVGSDGGGRPRKLSKPERLLREVVSESIPVMAHIFQELPDETIESTKEYLKGLIGVPEKSDELLSFQKRLERSDFTFELLSKSHKAQLDILVTLKTGQAIFLSAKMRLPMTELVEIFLLLRCRNVNCKGLLPVDDCDCKICSSKKGFCSACMCPVCFKFDCANKTCSWVGCDVCSHWCHAVCGIQSNLIKPGSGMRGKTGSTEMQFYCPGCGHASEMFGFVKDVFELCPGEWGLETLIKELDYVRQIFQASEDSKGKELHNRAEQLIGKLKNKVISPADACNGLLQFFKYGITDASGSMSSFKDAVKTQMSQKGNMASAPPPTSLGPQSISYSMHSSGVEHDMLSFREDAHQNNLKPFMTDQTVEEELQSSILSKNGFNSLESIVRIKEAEARMFQAKADDARREAERYRRMVRANSEKLEEEYTSKLAKLCLQETEERRRKKLEELKALENSHCDYYNMKIRMQAEIAGLLERMEATKQQCV